MNDLQKKRLEKSDKIKQGGLFRFYFMRGIGWGFSCGVVMNILALTGILPMPAQRYPFMMLILGLFMVSGLFWGTGMWLFTMWSYSRAKKEYKEGNIKINKGIMGKIYLNYRSVPELASLSPELIIEVVRNSGRMFGKIPQFKRVWWLGFFLSFVVPIIVCLIIYFLLRDFIVVGWCFTGSMLIGYSTWFHIRTSCLRPHIRTYLSEKEASEKIGKQADYLNYNQHGN